MAAKKTLQSTSLATDLPENVIQRVLDFTGPKVIPKVASVCSAWRTKVDSDLTHEQFVTKKIQPWMDRYGLADLEDLDKLVECLRGWRNLHILITFFGSGIIGMYRTVFHQDSRGMCFQIHMHTQEDEKELRQQRGLLEAEYKELGETPDDDALTPILKMTMWNGPHSIPYVFDIYMTATRLCREDLSFLRRADTVDLVNVLYFESRERTLYPKCPIRLFAISRPSKPRVQLLQPGVKDAKHPGKQWTVPILPILLELVPLRSPDSHRLPPSVGWDLEVKECYRYSRDDDASTESEANGRDTGATRPVRPHTSLLPRPVGCESIYYDAPYEPPEKDTLPFAFARFWPVDRNITELILFMLLGRPPAMVATDEMDRYMDYADVQNLHVHSWPILEHSKASYRLERGFFFQDEDFIDTTQQIHRWDMMVKPDDYFGDEHVYMTDLTTAEGLVMLLKELFNGYTRIQNEAEKLRSHESWKLPRYVYSMYILNAMKHMLLDLGPSHSRDMPPLQYPQQDHAFEPFSLSPFHHSLHLTDHLLSLPTAPSIRPAFATTARAVDRVPLHLGTCVAERLPPTPVTISTPEAALAGLYIVPQHSEGMQIIHVSVHKSHPLQKMPPKAPPAIQDRCLCRIIESSDMSKLNSKRYLSTANFWLDDQEARRIISAKLRNKRTHPIRFLLRVKNIGAPRIANPALLGRIFYTTNNLQEWPLSMSSALWQSDTEFVCAYAEEAMYQYHVSRSLFMKRNVRRGRILSEDIPPADAIRLYAMETSYAFYTPEDRLRGYFDKQLAELRNTGVEPYPLEVYDKDTPAQLLVARKVTGDLRVPSGSITFMACISEELPMENTFMITKPEQARLKTALYPLRPLTRDLDNDVIADFLEHSEGPVMDASAERRFTEMKPSKSFRGFSVIGFMNWNIRLSHARSSIVVWEDIPNSLKTQEPVCETAKPICAPLRRDPEGNRECFRSTRYGLRDEGYTQFPYIGNMLDSASVEKRLCLNARWE